MTNNIGRELKASELKPNTVVIIKPPGKNIFITLWVISVTNKLVEFYSGEIKLSVINFIQPDGSIQDDQQRTVHVFEYLGDV